MSRPATNGTGWAAFIGWFVDRRFIVSSLLALLVVGGLYVSPFRWLGDDVPIDPVPVDAIPDVGENQQIVFTRWPGRSPRDVEDQITYPLTTALMGIPGVRTVRSASALGFSTVYVIFNDEVDFYWSRSRVLEKLASLPRGTLPSGVAPSLGPDATALGQVFWYTLEGRAADGQAVGGWDAHELRSIQDWVVRFALQSVDGVSEVASIGGHVREYQVDVDPEALRAHGVSVLQVADAVRRSNLDVGARTLEINGVEYLVRGLGFIEEVDDLEGAVVGMHEDAPVRVRDVATVTLGPANRRGALDDAGAPAVGGVVVARYRENPVAVIERIHARIEELAPGLPTRTLEDGTVSRVTVVPFYDRTELIEETLGTLSTSLWHELLVSLIVVLVLLRDVRSSLVIAAILPLGVLGAFVAMRTAGVGADIMALGGIAIAIGTMVDVGIVFTENIASRLRGDPSTTPRDAVVSAAAEVAPAVFTSVLTTVVSFLPIFGLTAAESRLFAPLAYTKTFAMLAALVLALIWLPTAARALLGPRGSRPEPMTAARPKSIAATLRRLRDWARHLDIGRELLVIVLTLVWAVTSGGWWASLVAFVVTAAGLSRMMLWARGGADDDRLRRAQLIALVAGLVLELAMDWLPLGPEHPVSGVVLVVGVVGGLLATFYVFARAYPRLLRACLAHKRRFLLVPALIVFFGLLSWLGFGRVFSTLPAAALDSAPGRTMTRLFPGLGREYMPPFDEGAFLFMPTTMPHASFAEAQDMLQAMDARIAQVPEVARVVGKLGRVDSALDPAPTSMFETVVTFVPEWGLDAEGRRVRQWRDHIRTPRDIWDEIVAAAETPGVTSAPVLMPISARLVMLQSGMRSPMGIKVSGPDLATIEQFGMALERALRGVRGVRAESVFADRVVGKPYLEIDLDREAIGRHGLTVQDVQDVLQVAVGGVTLTRTVEGRERYPVRVRYAREERDSVEALEALSVPSPDGAQVPLGQLAEVRYVRGPQVIRSEDAQLTSYVLFDREPGRAEVDVVESARAHLAHLIERGGLEVPAGVTYRFAGTYENQLRSEQRLKLLVPIALTLVFMLLYLQFRRVGTSLMIYAGVLVAVAGAFVLLWLYAQPWFFDVEVAGSSLREVFRIGPVNLSIAVWVGVVALVGVATDDGVVMTTYLEQVFAERPPETVAEIRARTLEAGARRLRPCLMTTATTILALLPVISSQGRGADVMMPMALPVVGGMLFELVTLFVVPVLYCARAEWALRMDA